MGFAPRVQNYDPAHGSSRAADRVLAKLGTTRPAAGHCAGAERVALSDPTRRQKLYPNVDFYSGLISGAGFPTEMFRPVRIGRCRLIAQWREMLQDKTSPDRGRASCTRQARAPYVPLAERSPRDPHCAATAPTWPRSVARSRTPLR